MVTTEPRVPLVDETIASDIVIAATLNQNGRPVSFLSSTLTPLGRRHSILEKEAFSIAETVKKWRHFHIGNHFRLVIDQQSIASKLGNQ